MGKGKQIEFIILPNGCKVCTSHARTKDGHVRIQRNGLKTYLHKLVYIQHYGDIPDGLVVRHKCDNPACFNINHLELGTHSDNVADRVARNRSAIGERNGRSKLKEEDVRFIRNATNISNSQLARMFGVDPKAIRNIKKFRTWKHVV
jgi:hypothetical protein